ncbi:hemerythrin domain-containing protein [Bdellovibrio sp. 22V]|uniref:hemerythrin domain-containing protein n=1 Tax=Bdellovibrio TaxID=958 RepID=UPI002543A9BE|nr:hemerythrin domain-containing protein [Bdellovibrio sp. 22V]WII72578.1 hemerythrin domain-containing protein [Bdellovibrio sp. 22V]
MKTIYEVLEKDHREVETLFEEIEDALENDRDMVPELFDTLKTELTAHAKAEQEVFYEPLKVMAEDEEGHELSWEGGEEHHVICLLLNELSRIPFDSDQWAAKLKVLSELVDHHVEEEEEEIFKEAKKVFSNDDARQMAESLEELKEVYKGKIDEALAEDVELFMHPMLSEQGRSMEQR